MLRNYLTVALRNLAKHTGFSLINILGLTVGLSCFMLIALYIQDELSYDRYHTHADRIYRVTRDFRSPNGTVDLHLGHVAPPFGPLLQNDFPEVEKVARMLQADYLVSYGDKAFNENDIFIAEPSIFEIFTIPVISGDPQRALAEPFSVMLSEKTARKYFGAEDPLGQLLKIDNQFTVKVTGVFASFPANAHMHPEFMVSFSTLNDDQVYGRENLRTNWGNNSFATYLLLPGNYRPENLEAQFPAFLDRHMGAMAREYAVPAPSTWTHLYLQKLTDIHLHSHLDSEIEANGDIRYVYILSAIALFILLLACINFMNLATARSASRAKEIGMRKVSGALRGHLISQFLAESVLITLFALVLAIGITQLALPFLNDFTDKELSFGYLTNGYLLLVLLGVAAVVGVLAGLYPALYLSSFVPARVLKGQLKVGSGNVFLRKTLVVFQFAISVILIVCTGLVFTQLRYIQDKELGFDKDRIIILPYISTLNNTYESFRNELTRQAGVQALGRSSRIPSGRLLDAMGSATVEMGDSIVPSSSVLKYLAVDHDFIPAYQMELLAGRNFSREFGTDDSTAFIINEAAMRMIGWPDAASAVDKQFSYGGRKGRLIGVLKDFHFESMHQQIVPMVLMLPRNQFNYLSVKLGGANLRESLAGVENVWNTYLPGRPFEYTFMDENFGKLYAAEQRQGTLFVTFSVLAIFIACLGLFGLASFNAVQRTKEIGIRKVLGASVSGIVLLLSREFTRLVLIANLVAWPVAWFAMDRWLQNFAYRVPMGPGMFILAGLIALLIALLTVSYQSIKAALTNPVQSLRSE
jgi:putative ABC transport system permease protein